MVRIMESGLLKHVTTASYILHTIPSFPSPILCTDIELPSFLFYRVHYRNEASRVKKYVGVSIPETRKEVCFSILPRCISHIVASQSAPQHLPRV